MAALDLTQERLKELLNYDSLTGIFTWRVAFRLPRRRINIGDIAGTKMKLGYVSISVAGGRYLAHRLAWLYMTGSWPTHDVDHRDCDPGNNIFENLRLATMSQNQQNQRIHHSHNSSGFFGVSQDKRRRHKAWRARIALNGKEHFIGYFETASEAHTAYLDAKRELHEFCEI